MNDNTGGNPTTKPNGLGAILTGSILVSVASGIAYMTVYSYDLGASTYFGIPSEFISVSVVNLIVVALFVMLFAFVLAFLAEPIPPRVLTKLGNQLLILPALATLSGLAILAVAQSAYPRVVVVGLSILIGLLWIACFTLLSLSALGVLKPSTDVALLSLEHLAQFVPRQTAVSLVTSIFLLLFIIVLGFAAGFLFEKTRTTFSVTHEHHPKVILAIYGDTAVAADFDKKQKAVSATFTIYKVGQTLPPFTVTTLGPLKSSRWGSAR